MILTPTVLVLGAGCSMPYGFPSARELRLEICDAIAPGSSIVKLLEEVGFPPDVTLRFRDHLNLSGRNSVDEFLEHRPEFIDVGKAAIASALIPHEDHKQLFNPRAKSLRWYEYMFQQFMRGARWETLKDNLLSIITFNYDRSLDHFLLTALEHAFGKPYEDCFRIVNDMPILHIHGQIGVLRQGLSVTRPYIPDLTPQMVVNAARGIKIIHERKARIQTQVRAQELLQTAQRVCFLGFGYHLGNLERLGIHRLRKDQEIFGTGYGLTERERNQIRELFHGQLQIANDGEDVLDFLRNIGALS